MKEIVQKFQEDIEGHQAEVTIMEEDITIKIVVEDQDTIIREDIVAAAVAEGVEVVVVEIGPEEEKNKKNEKNKEKERHNEDENGANVRKN